MIGVYEKIQQPSFCVSEGKGDWQRGEVVSLISKAWKSLSWLSVLPICREGDFAYLYVDVE